MERDFVYSSLDPEIIRQMGIALNDHGTTLEHNLNEDRVGERRFEGIADNTMVAASAIDEFHSYVEERGLEFLKDIDVWLSEHETEDQGVKAVRLGAGAYLIRNEI